MSSVREIAKRAGVSITTVSRVLNNHPKVNLEMRDRVLAEVNRMRYAAAAGRPEVVNLGLVYIAESSASFMLNSPFDMALLQGMASEMNQRNYNLLILDAGHDIKPGETFTQMFHRRGIRAAVIRGGSRDRHLCAQIAAEGFPSVVIAERFGDSGDEAKVSFVRSDSRETSLQGVRHLISQGHRRIAICLNWNSDDDHTDRYESYVQALDEAGIELDQRMVIRLPADRRSGGQLIHRLQSINPFPTAVFITDPQMAIGALHEALNLGIRVPEQFSILGFDDAELRLDTFPSMAAVCQDARQVGAVAAQAALELLANPDAPPQRHVLNTWLQTQGSIGPVPTK
ncbi:MAG: LacI family DNA-binding transcriptional regulator [Phycisphaeraceae bacterium JB051]